MSNLMQFINKSKTIDTKCEEYTKNILQDYNNGIIKTETELLYRLKQAINDFYESIGKPSFKFIPARSTPISKDYNYMVQQANNDMKFIINDCINLNDAIKVSFIDNMLSKKMMFNEIKYINKKLEEIKEKININDNDGVVIYIESFINTDSMQNLYSSNGANVDTTDGVLMLGIDNEKNYSSGSKVEILEGSNGFPGNTHVVDIQNNDIHYAGENDIHFDLNNIIDKNNDTIFEYELFNVDDDVNDKCKGYGFNYKEGVSWVTDEEELKLRIKITLPNKPICNWLSLTPYFSDQKFIKPCMINKCIVSDGETLSQELNISKAFDDDTAIVFKPQIVSYIIIEFSQGSFYETNIGHIYFDKINIVDDSIFDDVIKNNIVNRVDGPMPSVQLLGMQYDPKTKKCIQQDSEKNKLFLQSVDEEFIRQGLFSIQADSEKIKSGMEVINAYRYAIGIKNLSISNYDFKDYGEYVSVPFATDDPITSVTLEAEESIPIEWNKNLTEDQQDKLDSWIRYYIKIGDEDKWYPILPKHRAFKGYCTYKINNGDIDRFINSTANKNGVATINIFNTITKIQLKIVLQKPEYDTYRTPILYQYKLNILTGGENIEY